MKENLNDLQIFLMVVRQGSFTRAAVQAGTSQSAVSQTINNLEQRLQLKLLNRTTRSLTLTEAGERLIDLIAPAMAEITDGLAQLAELREKPAGTVRISADEYAVQQVLWPALMPVLKKYPEIRLELITDYGLVDIAGERFDAGVRRGGLIAGDMIAVPISGENPMALVVSPECAAAYAAPVIPEDLLTLPCINLRLPTHGENFSWVFVRNHREQKLRVSGQLVVSSINQALSACLAGYGFAYLPRQLVSPHIAAGELLSMLDECCITYPEYYLYYTSRLKSSAAFGIIADALSKRR